MKLKGIRLLVTPTSFGKSDPQLKLALEEVASDVIYNTTGRPLTSAELVRLLPGIDGYIAGLDEIDRQSLQVADRLKVIARYGVGIDNIDLQTARDKKIIVTNTPGANSGSVAELTILFIILLARQLQDVIQRVDSQNWPRVFGMSIEGKTIGLLGLGSIGKQVSLRLRGFGCHIMAYDPVPDKLFAMANNINLVNMETLLKEADFVSLHLPFLPSTLNLVNKSFLSQMKKGSFIINTARGELIDNQALVEALQNGHVRGAALDVFSNEPPLPDEPLLKMPQVISTPHCGGHTDKALNSMGWMAVQDCLAVLQTKQPLHQIY